MLNIKLTLLSGLYLCVPVLVFSQITQVIENDGILILEDQDSVLFYQVLPKSHNGEYERNHYVHPLWNVDGMVLTEDFPADHLHQRGIFWAWHQILIDGKRTGDGWSLENFTQEVLSTGWEVNDDGSATLTTKLVWKSDLYTQGDKLIPYLLESSEIVIHPRQENHRQIDFEIQLDALKDPVGIGGSEDDKGYSGFSVRMKLPEDVKFTDPEGQIIQPIVTAVEAAGFVNVSGTFENNTPGGILIADHPNNPQYPQSWILRSRKSMQNAAFPGREAFTILPGKPLVLQYSLVTYSGSLSDKTKDGFKQD